MAKKTQYFKMAHNGQIPKCPLKSPISKKSPKMRQTVKISPNGQNIGIFIKFQGS